MHYPVQPREMVTPRSGPIHIVRGQVQEEIENFLQALNSYPARVAKDPGITFHQHLCSFFRGARYGNGNGNDNNHRARRQ